MAFSTRSSERLLVEAVLGSVFTDGPLFELQVDDVAGDCLHQGHDPTVIGTRAATLSGPISGSLTVPNKRVSAMMREILSSFSLWSTSTAVPPA